MCKTFWAARCSCKSILAHLSFVRRFCHLPISPNTPSSTWICYVKVGWCWGWDGQRSHRQIAAMGDFIEQCRALLLLNGQLIDSSQLNYQDALTDGYNDMRKKLQVPSPAADFFVCMPLTLPLPSLVAVPSFSYCTRCGGCHPRRSCRAHGHASLNAQRNTDQHKAFFLLAKVWAPRRRMADAQRELLSVETDGEAKTVDSEVEDFAPPEPAQPVGPAPDAPAKSVRKQRCDAVVGSPARCQSSFAAALNQSTGWV